MQLIEFIKKYFVYILAGTTIIFAVVALVYVQLQPTPTSPDRPIPIFSPSPTSFSTTPPPSNEIPRPREGVRYDASDEEKLRRDALVGQLLNKIPYSGVNFSLEYNYSNGQFVVTLKAGLEEAGNKEFDDFLKVNGVENRSWINNLTVKTN